MKTALGMIVLFALDLVAAPRPLGAMASTAPVSTPAARRWRCPMSEHTAVFDGPGTCPECGMVLVEDASARVVDVLVFDEAQDIDFFPLIQVFEMAHFQVHTVAPKKDPVRTACGVRLVPEFSFEDAPAPDILVVPGGGVHKPALPMPWSHVLPTEDDPRIFDWVRRSADHAAITLSVCNGAFVLARAGLLDGLPATTTANFVRDLRDAGKGIRPQSDRRWVDSGEKIVTSGGEACGIDAAYHVIARVLDEATAARLARQMEYRWNSDGKGLPPIVQPPAAAAPAFPDSRDGRQYPLRRIAGLSWFARNLDYPAEGSFCFDSKPENCERYGRLYPWRVAREACPSGAHLSTDEEWKGLEQSLGMDPADLDRTKGRGPGVGDALKAGGPSGFEVLFSGWRNPAGLYRDGNGDDRAAAFWTADEAHPGAAWHRDVSSARSVVWRSAVDEPYALSVRCVVDSAGASPRPAAQ